MKFSIALLILGTTTAAHAMDTPAYHYDRKAGRCVNSGGAMGFNSKHQGECGELWGANLKEANLSRSNLSGANLPRADLTGADLSGANLSGANLIMSRLTDTKLQGTIFNERTILPVSRKEAEKRGMIFVPTKETRKVSAR